MRKIKQYLPALFCALMLCLPSCMKMNPEEGADENPEMPGLPGDVEIPAAPSDPGDTEDEELDPDSQTVDYPNAVTLAFEGENVAVNNPFAASGVAVEKTGGHVRITSTREDVELNYVLSGASDNGSVKIYGNYKFGLILNGVGITNPKGAAVNIQCGKKITVTLVDQTTNRLIDGATYEYTNGEDMKGAFFSEGQLNFYGQGRLEVRGKNKHAICTDDYFRMYEGDIQIKEAASDGIHANDDVLIEGGTLTVRSVGDGIESENDVVNITGGAINVVTTGEKGHGVKSIKETTVDSNGTIEISVFGNASKGFNATGDMTVTKGTLTINTAGDAFYDAADADISSCAGIKCDGNLVIHNGTITILSAGKGGKGISADGALTINDGALTVNTTGAQYVYNRNYDTSAKAIKCDGNMLINGGDLVIRTFGTGAEGLESKATLTVKGGNIDIEAYDDAINAAKHIQFDGGNIYCTAAANDGIDSNGTMTVAGGAVISLGSEDSFDSDNNRFAITGGTLVGIGSGMMTTPTTSACTQRVLLFGSTTANLQLIRIEATSGGKEALTFKLPRSYSRAVLLFSSAALAANTGYTIYTGGSVADGSDFHGLYTGATYTKGTSAGTFTTSAMVTSVGSTSGGMGGPGGR